MTRVTVLVAALVTALVTSAPALALDYLSVATAAVLYDAPSVKAKPLFVIARDTPVEQIVVAGAWVKVRDSAGDLLFIEKQFLSEKRTVLVRVDSAKIRAEADDQAALSFEAERNVVLELIDKPPAVPAGWVKVRHRGGQAGFVKAGQVWGL